MASIRPLELKHGVGFCSSEEQPLYFARGFRHEFVNRMHNYYATPLCWRWPEDYECPRGYVIDAFSPNLNKVLHVGHLRNLAIANSLKTIFQTWKDGSGINRIVSLFGASLGVKEAALIGLDYWKKLLKFEPEPYYDVLMPDDMIEGRKITPEDLHFWKGRGGPITEEERYAITRDFVPDEISRAWDGPKGPVLIINSEGRKLYAHHDLVFAELVKPTHYITGHEQKGHFASLGLEDKHYPMGLVLGPDGKKLKSRDGNALTANEAMSLVCENLRDTEKPNQVAWNLLAWNFLHVSRSQDVKFEVEKWVDPNSAGMHITYTHARVNKALKAAGVDTRTSRRSTIWSLVDLLPPEDLTELDIKLLGFAEQSNYWADQARKKIDMAGLANYTHDLSRLLGKAYAAEKIVDGRAAFVLSMQYANNVLADCMFWLGMFLVEEV